MKRAARESYIASKCSAFSDFIYESAQKSSVGRLLSKYESERQLAEKSKIYVRIAGLWSSLNIKNFKFRIQKACEHSVITTFMNRITAYLLGVKVRQYGLCLFTFGIYAIIGCLLQYAMSGAHIFNDSFVWASVVCLFSLPCMAVRLPLSRVLSKSRGGSYILFDVLGIRRGALEDKENKIEHTGISFLIGMAFGVLSFFVSPARIIFFLLYIILAYTVFLFPETGLVLVCGLFPFVSTAILCTMILFTTFAFAVKLMRGKRTAHFELADISFFAFGLLILFGGLFSANISVSFPRAIQLISMMLVYYLTVNLCKNTQWIRRCMGAFITSSVVVSVIGIMQIVSYRLEFFLTEELTLENDRIFSVFGDPNAFAVFTAASVFFLFVAVTLEEKLVRRIFMLMLCALELFALYLTWSRAAWLAFAVSCILYFLITSRKTVTVLLCVIPLAAMSPFVLPSAFIERLSDFTVYSGSMMNYRMEIWRSAFLMMKDHLTGGTGVGTFSLIYPQYAVEGIESAPDSCNLYFQIICEIGIFGFIVFAIAVMLYMQSTFSFFRRYSLQSVRIAAAGLASVGVILVSGLSFFVFSDLRIFMLMWMVCGLSTASRRNTVESMRCQNIYEQNL